MPKAASRPSFPTSSTDFALPTLSNPLLPSPVALDDSNILLQRFRRPSLLTPKAGYLSESRLHSPLASSFTLHSRRRSQSLMLAEELESDRERMLTDSSSASSENPTPPLKQEEQKGKGTHSRNPRTPPRRRSSASMDVQDYLSPLPSRRLTFPARPPRIISLRAELRPEENEVKSEAAFQRLVTSCSELPVPPRTPKVAADRGRYPEEAGREESQREDTPSDDDEQAEDTPFTFSGTSRSEPIAIKKPHNTAGSVNGDDLGMSTSESSSLGNTAMDVDLVGRLPPHDNQSVDEKQPSGSPSLPSSMTAAANQWRYTPPPTTSAVRSNKRKLEDRFEPYSSASKRRAVSPSVSYLRDNHSAVGSPINGRGARLPISIPVNIPGSNVSSATSSPTISGSYPRPLSMTSSPTLRSSMVLASPILRPVPRHTLHRKDEEGEREVQGAGDAVGSLTLE